MTHLFIILSCLMTFPMTNQTPTYIEISGGETGISGNLSEGVSMPDLSWAWSSSNACFTSMETEHFTGYHRLYYFDLPSYTEVEIQLIPEDAKADFSLYAYEVGKVSESNTVPNLVRCVRCEADYKRDRPIRGRVQDHTRTVKHILAIRNPYQVVIGVAGAAGLSEGAFTLKIKKVN